MENSTAKPQSPEGSTAHVGTVKVTLRHRSLGVHEDIAETEIPGTFADYATPDSERRGDYSINEGILLAALPDGFLPCSPARILLAVEDETGGTGQRGLTRFRNWAKYFDAYCLNLHLPEQDGGTR